MGKRTLERRNIAKEVADKLRKKFPIRIDRIFLFGSVARGGDGDDSDIDIECLASSMFMPADFEGIPCGLGEYARQIEQEMLGRGYKVRIDLRNVNYFEKDLAMTEPIPDPTYGERFFRNVVNDSVPLYSSGV